MKKQNIQTGYFLIELLIAFGIAAIILPAIIVGVVASRQGRVQQLQRTDATPLLREAEEAVRVYREKDWNAFAVNGTYHPTISNGTWILASGSETINEFTRSIIISDTKRDANGVLVENDGTVDPSTKKVVSTVSWNTPFPSFSQATRYVTRYTNTSYTQTTAADFNTGIKTNVAVTNISGGEVTLNTGAGGNADWCKPNLSIAAVDLPKSGVANALSAIEGKVVAGTGENASGVSFANVTVSNTNPPDASVAGTYDGFKTNDVFAEMNFAYIATDNNTKEVDILDLTTQDKDKKYKEVGYFNAPGNGNAESVYVAGTIGYMTDKTDKLYTFNLSSKKGSRPLLGSVTLAGMGNKVFVIGNYAYVAVNTSSTQLQIIQVSPDGKTLTVVGFANLSGLVGNDVFVNNTQTRAYVATETSNTQRELFIVDITEKTGNRPTIGSYETNGMNPKGVTVVSTTRAIIVGTDAEEYQAVSITNETNPSRCGGLNIDTGINGVSSVQEADEDAYSYIITGDSAGELKIIEGGPGNQYTLSGIFESAIFDATKEVAFNSFLATATIPAQSSITYQFAGAHANPATGTCSGVTFTYAGPDGTTSSYYATSSALLISTNTIGYENPSRCIRYKAFFSTSDPAQSPTLSDVSINYSP